MEFKRLSDIARLIGQRVEIPPHYDQWVFGARYGEIRAISRDGNRARVKLDRGGEVRPPIEELRFID